MSATIVFSNVNMTLNEVSRSKGGAFYLDRDTVAVMRYLHVTGNKAFVAGGGGCIKSRASLTLDHAHMQNNGSGSLSAVSEKCLPSTCSTHRKVNIDALL